MTVPVYVAEAAPSAIRGRLVTLNQLFITIGILVSSLVAGGFSSMKETGWRYMLGLAAVPGIIQFIGFLYLPESPRWLVTKGREERAREVLRRIRAKDDVEEELEEIRNAVAESQEQSGFVLGRVLRTAHFSTQEAACLFTLSFQWFESSSSTANYRLISYYSGTILKMAGFPAKQAIWLVTIPFSINFLFTIMGVVLVERLGRKRLLMASFVGVTIALIVLAVGFQLSDEFSPAIDRNITEVYSNGTMVTDDCVAKQFSTCEECITEKHCGFCYSGSGDSNGGSCLRADEAGDKEDEQAVYGRCDSTNLGKLDTKWAHGYCPTDYTWMAVLGLTLFVMAFAPGLGPMPWTINSEIYPLWARGTGNAIATGCNWICNLVVSLFFLTLTETITKYGAFWLFCGICTLGLLFTAIFVPETKNKSLEEMEDLFRGMASNTVGADNKGYDKEINISELSNSEKKDDTKF
ncbi:proton myo-inositol cotransporter [Plakobranchus ocellatus]|uniref:Proton myo-inositol cotransporter n=1 Tax=Plakobranchus ocellatus TaxID=259542 RepID=A0AAV4B963_9GAST|nr:proton myo-inositol cotransporter [Plakobranchus ocellatus]